MSPEVAVLFASANSIYKTFPWADVYDEARDARTYTGSLPVIAHPPCRLWGRLRYFSTAPQSEKELALFALEQVRRWGGVLEHPVQSRLWQEAGLPWNGTDIHGGWSMQLPQYWFGHTCLKATWLYVVGIDPRSIPTIPLRLGLPPKVIGASSAYIRRSGQCHASRAERLLTPEGFALWLYQLARLCQRKE